MKSAFFWVITQRVVLTPYRRFEKTYRFHRIQEDSLEFLLGFLDISTWNPIGCPETSVRNCHEALPNNSKERRSHLLVNSLWLLLEVDCVTFMLYFIFNLPGVFAQCLATNV
jgi:hypothetical protein